MKLTVIFKFRYKILLISEVFVKEKLKLSKNGNFCAVCAKNIYCSKTVNNGCFFVSCIIFLLKEACSLTKQQCFPQKNAQKMPFLPARRCASAGYRDRNVSVCPSVCLSVRPSVRHAPVLCQNEES